MPLSFPAPSPPSPPSPPPPFLPFPPPPRLPYAVQPTPGPGPAAVVDLDGGEDGSRSGMRPPAGLGLVALVDLEEYDGGGGGGDCDEDDRIGSRNTLHLRMDSPVLTERA